MKSTHSPLQQCRWKGGAIRRVNHWRPDNNGPEHVNSVCVCVVVPSILSAGFYLWGASAGVTQEEGQHTGDFYFLFVLGSPPSFCGACLSFFIARRVQHSLSLVDREVDFCVPTTKSLSTVGCCARKNPRLLRDLNPRPNRQKVTRLPTEPPGRPASRGGKGNLRSDRP